MSILDRAELLLQAKNYSGSGDWLDESGNGHDAQLGSTSGADTNDPLFKPWNGTDYLYLPGSASNYVSTPDVNQLDADTAHNQQSRGGLTSLSRFSSSGLVASSEAEFGDYVSRHVRTATSTAFISTASEWQAVAAATTYVWSTRIWITDGASASVQLGVNEWTGASADLGQTLINPNETLVDGWNTLTFDFTTDATAATARFRLYEYNGAVDDVLDIDWSCLRTGSDGTFVPSLRIVGDLDIEAKVALNDWTPASSARTIGASRWGDTQNAFLLWAAAGGSAGRFQYYYEGESSSTSWLTGDLSAYVADGEPSIIRLTHVPAGALQLSIDGTVRASTTATNVGTRLLNAGALNVGAYNDGADGRMLGDIYYAIVRDGIDGPIVAEYRPSDASEPFATHTGSVDGRTWTHNRSSSGLVSTVVDRAMFLLTTDDYFEIADDAALDFSGSEALTVLAVVRPSTVAAGQDIAVAKKDNLTTSAGWALGRTTAASQFIIADGTADDDDTAGTMTANTLYTLAGVRNVTDDDIEAFLSGTGSGTPTTDSTTATLANALPVRIGATSNTAANFWEGQIVAVALFREALSDTEVAQVGNLLVSGGAEDFVVSFAPLAAW